MELETQIMSIETNRLVRKSDLNYVLEPQSAKKIGELVKSYGVISPIIVEHEEGKKTYGVIKGWETLEAARQKGDRYINAVCIRNTDLGVQTRMALSISAIEEKVTAVSQGWMVKHLNEDENMSLKQLSQITGKSISWASKKKSLVENLCRDVLEMVEKSKVAPRTAEEIAKLPLEKQSKFTVNAVIKGGMSKNKITELVRLYNYSHTDEKTKQKIVENPKDILVIEHERKKKLKHDKFGNPENVIAEAMECVSSAMSRIAMMSDGLKTDSNATLVNFEKCLRDAARNLANFMGITEGKERKPRKGETEKSE
jgi:ParB-like chromosome segregation protein Spo0J